MGSATAALERGSSGPDRSATCQRAGFGQDGCVPAVTRSATALPIEAEVRRNPPVNRCHQLLPDVFALLSMSGAVIAVCASW